MVGLSALSALAAAGPAPAATVPRATTGSGARALEVAGGELVSPSDWPFAVALIATYGDGSQARCSGAAIGARWVLTAAHCLTDPEPVRVDVATVAGVVAAEASFVNPAYDPATSANDVGVLRLASDFPAPALRMATQADAASFAPGQPALVLGWGATSLADTSPPALRAAAVEIASAGLCGVYPGFSPSLMLCAGLAAGVGACVGDSGGPLVALDRFELPVLVGTVSYGPAEGCGTSLAPDVYARIATYAAGLASFLAADPAAPVGAPAVASSAATATSATTATVAATINSSGLATTYRVEFGPGTRPSRSVAGYAGAGGPVTVEAALTGLTPGTTYSYRVVAANAAGEVAGATQTFTLAGQAPAVDTVPPTVRALPSSGRAGGVVRLRYRVFDDASARTREVVTVLRPGGSRVATVRTRFSPSERGIVYHVRWRAPRSLVGRFRFCVQAEDPSGNRSVRSCAPLMLRAPAVV